MTPTWDLKSVSTAKLLDLLHEYSQAHAAVTDKKTYEHPDSDHHAAHWYNMRWAVARELENRGYKDHLLPLVTKSLNDLVHLRLDRPPVDIAYLLAKGLGPGERWVTVHPHGDASPGIPILITEKPDGTAHVIGGAGGSLNYVKLTNLKSPEQYREHAKQKAGERREAEKQRLAGMSPEDREAESAQKGKIDEEKRKSEDDHVANVYKMMGMEAPKQHDPEEMAKEHGIPVAVAKIAIAREREAHKAAVRHLASAVRDHLIDDHEAAAQAGLGDLSLRKIADPELYGKQSMDLLQKQTTVESSGIKSDFKGRAEGAGATSESVKEEGNLVKERAREGQDQEQRQFSDKISQNIQDWNAQAKELENQGHVKNNILKIDKLPASEHMLPILQAERGMAQASEQARQQKQEVKGGVNIKPFVVNTSNSVDEAVVKQFMNESQTQTARAMLSRVEGEQGLTRHVRNGAFDALNQVALTLSGQELLGREVVDFIGSAGASQLLAQRLRNTLSDEDFTTLQTAVESMHGRDNAAIAKEAMKMADEELERAKKLENQEVQEPMDVIAARALNDERMDHIQNSREILGDAYGRLVAMGELSMAMKGAQKGDKEITCDLGGTPRDQAILMARSFGLTPEVDRESAEESGIDVDKIGHEGEGDYRLDAGSGKSYIKLKPSALPKMVAAFDPADTKHYEEAQAIKQGKGDQVGWLPAGFNKESGVKMSGATIKQQRAIRMALKFKRVGLHMGAGSGKTATAIGTFTEMHSKGEAQKAVFAVPSSVQVQFGGEIGKFTEPGKYKVHADPKATREERMKTYSDDSTHMIVTTHHTFRDDLVLAVAQHTGKDPKDVQKAFKTMPEEARRQAMQDATKKLGWKVDFLGIDEAHGLLNRQGKPDSSMANAIDAFSHNTPNYLSMTGTPVKNDASEAFDLLKKIDPARFTDQESFMRKYGVNTPTNWASLQRLMARYVYADRISSGVERNTETRQVKLHPEQQKQYSGVRSALNKVRQSRKTGNADIEAVKHIAPESFEGVPPEKHQEHANEVATNGLGGRLNAKLHGIVNGTTYENNAKIDAMREDLQKDKGKPHVIFAHNYKSIDHIKKLCDELGMKVGVISGDMSPSDKARVRKGFQPEDGGEARYDVLLNTDAGSTGQNLQRGTILLNYDTPDTAMTHEQRAARIDRMGQTQDVTVRDYVTDTPVERTARKRLEDKYELSDVFQSPSELLDDTGFAGEIEKVRQDKKMSAGTGNTSQRQDDHWNKMMAMVNEGKEQRQEQPQLQAAQGPEATKKPRAPRKPKAAPVEAPQPEAAPEQPKLMVPKKQEEPAGGWTPEPERPAAKTPTHEVSWTENRFGKKVRKTSQHGSEDEAKEHAESMTYQGFPAKVKKVKKEVA